MVENKTTERFYNRSMKISAVPPHVAEVSHRALTEAIRPSDVAYWRDGTRKGCLLDVMLSAHAKQDPLLVKRTNGYEIWVRKEEPKVNGFSKEDFR